MSIEECIDLVNSANILEISSLVDLASARLASEMMSGTIEEVRAKFGVDPNMTEDELKEFDKYPLD